MTQQDWANFAKRNDAEFVTPKAIQYLRDERKRNQFDSTCRPKITFPLTRKEKQDIIIKTILYSYILYYPIKWFCNKSIQRRSKKIPQKKQVTIN